MNEKWLGYTLLGVGIVLMALSVYFVYSVLTNKIQPFSVFMQDSKERIDEPVSLEDLAADPQSIVKLQSQIMSQLLEQQLNKTMNLGATIFLMYFLMLFGFRLSTLGVQLVRPIHVDLKTGPGQKPQ